jgi:flagellar FliL protein
VEAPAAPPQKKSKLLLIVLAVVVLLAAGGAATWWFMHPADENEEAEVPVQPSVFLPLEQFTVNLQPEEGQQFLQVAMTLRVSDQDIAEGIKAQMPQVRSRILFLLSSKKPSELSSVEGKNKLSEQLLQEAEAVLPAVKGKKSKHARGEDTDEGKSKKAKNKKAKAKEAAEAQEEPAPRRVLAVYFTHFIVQ